VLRTRK